MKRFSATLEDYLEAIYICERKNTVARIKDLSELLSVKPPTALAAVRRLERNGMVHHEHYGYVKLTSEGKKMAERIYRRHRTILKFMVEILGIPEIKALSQACGMEHSISCKTRDILGKLTKFFLKNPEIFEKWKEVRE